MVPAVTRKNEIDMEIMATNRSKVEATPCKCLVSNEPVNEESTPIKLSDVHGLSVS